jgi:hypothetical protein
MQFQSVLRRTAQASLVLGLLATGSTLLAPIAQAQNGVTLFSGVERGKELSYHFDFGGKSGNYDRLRLRVKKEQMKLAAAQFIIAYPDYYKGQFDPKDIQLRVNGKEVKIQETRWDEDNYRIEVYPIEPVAANSKVEISLSNIRTPNSPGMYYFKGLIQAPGDVPIMRELGTWIVTVD